MFSKVHIRFPHFFLHINPPIIIKLMLLLFIIENSIFNSKITWFLQLEKYKQMGSLESICMHIDT